jgi:hypothetical protein
MLQLIKQLFCGHDYDKLDHYEIPSESDAIYGMGLKPTTWSSFTRKYITVYKCNKCGKLKRFKESTKTF